MKDITDLLKTKADMSLPKKTVLNIAYTSNLFKDGILCSLKPFDLSIEQFNVLRILRGKHGEATNLRDIQDRMLSKMSNTTRLVDKLIAKGYVERFVCKNNRRKVDIFITEDGLKILSELDPLIDRREKALTQNLDKQDLELLNRLLTKLRD